MVHLMYEISKIVTDILTVNVKLTLQIEINRVFFSHYYFATFVALAIALLLESGVI